MINRYAIVEQPGFETKSKLVYVGVYKVVQIVLWDGDVSSWTPSAGTKAVLLKASENCCIGAIWDGTNWTLPQPVIIE